MIISGVAIPLDQLNHNRWGIRNHEVDNAISTLKSSTIRLCDKLDHACDFTNSALHQVGSVMDAFYDSAKNAIVAKVSITHPKAEQYIREGKLKAWSVFGTGNQDTDGWVSNYTNKSLTLVADPAWETAKFASSSQREFSAKYVFEETMAPDDKNDPEAKFTKELNEKFASKDTEIDKKIADLSSKFDQVIASKDQKITDLEKQINELKASKETPKESATKTETPPTITQKDLDVIKADITPKTDIDALVASKIAEYQENKDLAAAKADYTEVATSLGIKVEDALFANKNSAMINADLAVLKQVAAARSTTAPQYRAIPEEYDNSGKLTVGIPAIDATGKITGWSA